MAGVEWFVYVHPTGGIHDVLELPFAPDPGDWIDLSARVRSISLRAGRQDRTSRLDPTTVTIVLDNSDQQLDPLKEGSLVELAESKCLPLSPVEIWARQEGSTDSPLLVFSGVLGPEAWIVERSRQAESTSTIQAVDAMGWYAQLGLPSSPFAAYLLSTEPDWWVRSLGGPLAGNGGLLQDESGNDYLSFIEASGSGVFFASPSLVDGDNNASMRVTANAAGVTKDATVTAASSAVSAACVWKGSAASSNQTIMRQRRTAGQLRWQVYCSPGGQIAAAVYDTGGVLKAFAVAPSNPDGGRWDDDEPHLICLGITGGSSMRIWVDSRTTLTTASVIPATFDGRIIFGNGPQTYDIDEVAFWRRRISLTEMNALGGALRGTTWPFAGDNMLGRLNRWFELARVTRPPLLGGDLVPPDPDPEFAGISEIPANVAEGIYGIGESYGGFAWINREGRIQIRHQNDYESATIEALYGTVQANLTDEPTPDSDPLPVRRSQPEWTGVRLDRVVNVSSVEVGGLRFDLRDDASIVRYGERPREWSSDLADVVHVVGLARTDARTNSAPVAELRQVVIDPTVDDGAAEFVVDHLDLMVLVNLTWTPHGGSAQQLLCQVQGYEIEAVPEHSTVALSLAPLRDPVALPEPEPDPEPILESALFEFTGAVQEFEVPTGVGSLIITAAGASGGGASGGGGAIVSSTITTTPGETLEVYVGGAGSDGAGAQAGGWNGGAASGGDSANVGLSASGGGASDVRQGGSTLADRVVVAGGGGGQGGRRVEDSRPAGGGGGEVGVDGADAPGGGADGGDGGTASAGGAGGAGLSYRTGSAGALGVGGAGGDATSDPNGIGGGGGGGGYYGGGGGGSTITSGTSLQSGAGGGGSSLASGADNSFTAGAHFGDGLVLIEWEAP